MYLNTEKGNTNIDSQFNNNKKFSFKDLDPSKLKTLIIALGVLVAIAIVIIVVMNLVNKTNYFIDLEGEENMSIYQGDTFVDPGYTGRDNKGNDLTNIITVDNPVDSSKTGTYEVTYKLKNVTKKRTVTVIEKGTGYTSFYLKGDENLTLNVGATYEEPGYIAIDSIDSDITSKVEVNSNLDTSKKGAYRIIYTVTNSFGITTSKTRTIIVK